MAGPLRWLARGEHELPAEPRWLTAREAARAAGMRFTKRRTEYLLRRWAGKQAVAAATGIGNGLTDLARIEVANRLSGAPYVLIDGAPLGLDVSLTDRAGWAVCLVGSDLSRLGCDLEVVESRSAGFVADYLTAGEQAYVTGHSGAEDRDAAANLLWSAKESALKVLRVGLRRDTRSVEVRVDGALAGPHGWLRLDVGTPSGRRLSGWWRRDGAFLLTVAADGAVPPPQVLPGSADLAAAVPVHSWVRRPVAPPWPAR